MLFNKTANGNDAERQGDSSQLKDIFLPDGNGLRTRKKKAVSKFDGLLVQQIRNFLIFLFFSLPYLHFFSCFLPEAWGKSAEDWSLVSVQGRKHSIPLLSSLRLLTGIRLGYIPLNLPDLNLLILHQGQWMFHYFGKQVASNSTEMQFPLIPLRAASSGCWF